MVGRAYAYGLGATGGAGVARAIEILRTDLIRTLKLLGSASVAQLDRSYVDVPTDWGNHRSADVTMLATARLGSSGCGESPNWARYLATVSFGASEATIFSKQGSPRSGSQYGSSFNSP
jgi:hypothetical protein